MAGTTRYVDPVPGGTIGRTDMGVDISAPPGTPIRAIADSEYVGTIPNWFRGQPFLWFRILGTRMYWYVAEQITPRRFRRGERVAAGAPVGRVAPSGTALELGWATSSGRTLAQATTGYREGQVTPAGRDFRSRVLGHASAPAEVGWAPCVLSWYDPALGGINTTGGPNPHARTASGEPYDANKFTCAAPPAYAFGTRITFKYRGTVITCRVNDRGGAIVGNHFDLSRAAARRLGVLAAGKVNAQFSVGNAPAPGSSGVVRPGGTTNDDSALIDAFRLAYADDDAGTGARASETVSFGGNRTTEPVGLFGLPFGPSIIPGIPTIPGVPLPAIPDPLDIFKGAEKAINGIGDFLKWISWLFHPRNILRAVEFVTGITLLGGALHSFIEAARGDPYNRRKRARQGRRREARKKVVRRVVEAAALVPK